MYKDLLKSLMCDAVDQLDEAPIMELCNEKLSVMVKQIQNVLLSYDDNDFECVEEIVSIMEKNGFDCGSCHDL